MALSAPKIIGHRGCAGLLPENSLSACRKAIELGLDGLEIDVQLSAENEVVVYHNLTIDQQFSRYKNTWLDKAGPAINSLTVKELEDYDIGCIKLWSWYRLKRIRQKAILKESIPTLRQIMELVRSQAPSTFKLWVEVKTNPLLPELSAEPDIIIDRIITLVEEFNLHNQVTCLSFDWRGLQHLKLTAPDIPRAYLTIESGNLDTVGRNQPEPSLWMAGHQVASYNGSIPQMIKANGGKFWAARQEELSQDTIDDVHQHGLQVYAWTVNNPFMMQKLAKWGVDGIITDYPNLALKILK